MKRFDYVKSGALVALCFCASMFFASCKTTGGEASAAVAAKKTPFEVLSNDSAVYLKMPVKENMDLAVQIITSKVQGISEKDAKRLAKQINVLWAGLSSKDNLNRAEFYASGSYPPAALASVLTEKNGWKKKNFLSPTEDDIPYYMHSSAKMEISFPSMAVLCASTNVKTMLNNLYSTNTNTADFVSWMENKGGEDSSLIKFYVTDASKFITSFMGGIIPNSKNFAANCKDIYGTLLQKSGEDYLLSLKINLNNPKAAGAYLSMLKLGFALAGITVTQPDEKTISVQDIPVKQSQIISLL
ncbi:MAG TPA: hypothetical protein DCZ76_01140 [Treponema sp.]|nr:hypothetical protein [Treponema sp.]